MVVLSAVGGGWGLLALAPLLLAARARRVTGWLLGTLVAVTVIVFVIKAIVGRARPCACVPGVHALCFAAPTDPSFPSGHAAGSFAFAAFVITMALADPAPAQSRVGVIVLASAFAIGVAMSRVVLGVHFPSDVIAGALLGALCGRIGATRALRC